MAAIVHMPREIMELRLCSENKSGYLTPKILESSMSKVMICSLLQLVCNFFFIILCIY